MHAARSRIAINCILRLAKKMPHVKAISELKVMYTNGILNHALTLPFYYLLDNVVEGIDEDFLLH